jgi:Flp pilus assembly protein TadD
LYFRAAACCLFAVLRLSAQEAESHFKQGLALKKNGDVVGAKAELRQAITINPKFNAARFYLAEILLDEGRPSEALAQLRVVPRSVSVDKLLGLAYLESGEAEQAAQIFHQHPADSEAHYYLGIALGQQGQLVNAIQEFKRAIALKADFGAAHESLGIAFRRQGDSVGALREFQMAAHWMPKNPVTLCDLGMAWKEAGKWEEAETALRGALTLKPDFERARYALGLVLRMRGDKANASEQMKQVRALHEQRAMEAQSRKLILDGVAALKGGHADEAVAAFQKAESLNPADASAFYYNGLAEEKGGSADHAAALYRKAIALKPDYAEVHMRLGILRARARDNEAALEEMHIALAADTDSAEAHYNLAKLLAVMGHANESVSEAEACLAIDASYLEARMLVGNLLSERGDYDRAAAAYGEVLRRKPDFAEAHNNLGLVFLNGGKKELAEKEFRAALRLKPDYSAAQQNLELAIRP